MSISATCTRCGATKSVGAFPVNPSMPSGRGSQCNECQADRQRRRRAGIQEDKCATCGVGIRGEGVCTDCMLAIDQLGNTPEALRQAALALKWIRSQ